MTTIPLYENWEEAARLLLTRRPMSEATTVPFPLRKAIERIFGQALSPAQAVARIVADVRERGDEGLRFWTSQLDGVEPSTLEVARPAWQEACRTLDPDLRGALELAARRIRAFHERQQVTSWSIGEGSGYIGQRVVPLKRVGIYVPGGTAPLPSSLLMAAIPARVAGVEEIVVCTPPRRDSGSVAPVTLAAADVAGVDRVFAVGGAQAIAAMAFGTRSIPRVDKIVGAGGLFTTLAKREVFGFVGLDGLYGPTETVIVADESANPLWVAADLLAQAEHDVLATAILLTPSRPLALAVAEHTERLLGSLDRNEVIRASLAAQGGILLTPDLDTAVRLADEFAPEHLCLAVREPERWLPRIRNAGGVFLGEYSCEVLGDYVAGPSHLMPTGGTARFASPVNVLDFVRVMSVVALDRSLSVQLARPAFRLAQAESLTAHAHAARCRADEAPGEERQGPPQAQENPSIEAFIRPDIAGLVCYAPVPVSPCAAPDDIVKLDANENPYGPPPEVWEALRRLENVHRYPDPQSSALREALAAWTGVPAEQIVAGAGSDELLNLIARLFLGPGDVAIHCPPSFGMYPVVTTIAGARVLTIPRKADFRIPVEELRGAIRKCRPRVIFLASPNNPDGSWLSDEELDALLALPVVVVLDEAYVEFAGHERSRIRRVPQEERLIVLRTFSKWAGLAGLRVGYAALPRGALEHFWKIKLPYNVSVAASAAAIAALEAWPRMEERIAQIVAERERLARLLAEIPYLQVYPSEANFLLCRVLGRSARGLKESLERESIWVRHVDQPGVEDCLRITVGRPEETDRLIAALRRL